MLEQNEFGKQYVTINNGCFAIRANETAEGAEPRVVKTKNGGTKTVYELRGHIMSGTITKLAFVQKDFGDFLEITIASDCDYVVQIPWKLFKLRDGFLKRLPNINLERKVQLCVFTGKSGDTVLIVKQSDATVPMAYTKENPNGLPPPTKEIVLGKEKYDFRATEQFLFNLLKEKIEFIENKGITNCEPLPF